MNTASSDPSPRSRAPSLWPSIADILALARPHFLTVFLAALGAGVLAVACVKALPWYLSWASAVMLYGVLSAGVTWYLMRAYLGQRVTWDALLAPLFERPIALLVLLLLRQAAVAMAMLIFMTSGSPAATVGIGVMLLVGSILLTLDLPVLMTQQVGPFTAMALSANLVRKHLFLFIGASFVGNLLAVVLSGILFPFTASFFTILSMRTLEAGELLVGGRAPSSRTYGRAGGITIAALYGVLVAATSFSAFRLFGPAWLTTPSAPTQVTVSAAPTATTAMEAHWIDDGGGHFFRVLESRQEKSKPFGLEVSVVWQVRNRASTTLDLSQLPVGLMVGDEIVHARSTPSQAFKGLQIAPGADSRPVLSRLGFEQSPGNFQPLWGLVRPDGKSLGFAIALMPLGTQPELEKVPGIEAYAPPALPWKLTDEQLDAIPDLSLLRPTAEGCEWQRQSAAKAAQVMAKLPECGVSIAVSGDGLDSAVLQQVSGSIAWLTAQGAQQTVLPNGGSLVAFDSRGALIALMRGVPRRSASYDGKGWALGATAIDGHPSSEPSSMYRRTVPLIRTFHCRLLHAYSPYNEPQPLTWDECTTPDAEPYAASPRGERQEALATSVGALVGHVATPRRLGQGLTGPFFVKPPHGETVPLLDLDAANGADNVRIAVRGPYALFGVPDDAKGGTSYSVYDLRTGKAVLSIEPGAVAVAFWPLGGGPPAHVVPAAPAPPSVPAKLSSPAPRAAPPQRKTGHRRRK